MACDMCGRPGPLLRAKIEGTVLDVCKGCAKFGEIVAKPRPISLNKKKPILKKQNSENIEIIVPNYYVLIRNAREKKGLKQEEAARQLAERESLYHKVEKGQIKPSMTLARKLERFYNITLVEEYKDKMQATIAAAPMNKGSLTIGDMIRMKK